MTPLQFKDILTHHLLLLDGAMGTMIQSLGLSEEIRRGERFASHPFSLEGCNDILSLTRSRDIAAIHRAYLQAGADIICANTFNANAISLAEYGLHTDHELIHEINRTSATLAKAEALASPLRPYGGHALVAGSIGPTSATAYLGADGDDPTARSVDFDALVQAYTTQIRGLIEGGVDLLLFETVFDTLNLKAGLYAASALMAEMGTQVPIMVSATLAQSGARTLTGQSIEAFMASIQDYECVVSVGFNCGFGPEQTIAPLHRLAAISPYAVSVHPNAGLPDELGHYSMSGDEFARALQPAMSDGLINIVGGCCGTRPEHIAALRSAIDTCHIHLHTPATPPTAMRFSSLECVSRTPHEESLMKVGERCNVAGSRKFLRLINEGKYEEALNIAVAQVHAGALMLDINMDDPLLDAPHQMVTFLRWISSDAVASSVPVMIDSSDINVVIAALKNIQGRSIVNSISLKDGEQEFLSRARAIRALGAAVVVMASDEMGQGDTLSRKTEICHRAYRLLTEQAGFAGTDIIFDPNVMAVGTGIEEHARYALDFIEAVRWIKSHLPGAGTVGGVSNLSFAFRGKNSLRRAMHTVFLHHALQAGLDMAIMDPSAPTDYDAIEPQLRSLLEDVILARHPEAAATLAEYAIASTPASSAHSGQAATEAPVQERLQQALIHGTTSTLEADLQEALAVMPAEQIINGPLLQGMNRVGTLFANGEMFLPQVVRTARTMKCAVDILTPFMQHATAHTPSHGKVLIATVKGDVHDIGKNIVATVLSCSGWQVSDLGVMVPAQTIVEHALRECPDIICLSGLISPSLHEMSATVSALKQAGITTPVMVGGATTSALHTALKIAPAYDGVVLHAPDASFNPAAAASLTSADSAAYIAQIQTEQQRLRDEWEASHPTLSSIEQARAKAHEAIGLTSAAPLPATELGVAKNIELPVSELTPFISWKMLLHAWRVAAGGSQAQQQAESLLSDARDMLASIADDARYYPQAEVAFYPTSTPQPELLMIAGTPVPLLRQQRTDLTGLSLADFLAPEGDTIGLFAVTAGSAYKALSERYEQQGDKYRSLLALTLADRIAEAASELLHYRVRTHLWGYNSAEELLPEAILRGQYPGIRPAFGYPSLPDQGLAHILEELLPLQRIGVSLTDAGAFTPAATVAGLYIASEQARYFLLGPIGDDQLQDYARARDLSTSQIRSLLRL